jgi:hypothetical protein
MITPAPIALFAYNRPQHLARVLATLTKNPEAGNSVLHVFSDGPRGPADAANVVEVRRVVENIRGFARVETVFRSENAGLARSIVEGVTRLCNTHGRVIVVEDDLEVSPYFLRYMNAGLEMYEHDEQVVSIHGYLLPVDDPLPETFFLKGADCWGWATWKRAWDWYEPDGKKLFAELMHAGLQARFDFNDAYDYTGMLRAQIAGRNDSWAVRWYAATLLRGGFTLYPGRSLVHNIGHDRSGTHGGDTQVYDTRLSATPIRTNRILIEENPEAYAAIQRFLWSMKPSLARRLSARLGRVWRKIAA